MDEGCVKGFPADPRTAHRLIAIQDPPGMRPWPLPSCQELKMQDPGTKTNRTGPKSRSLSSIVIFASLHSSGGLGITFGLKMTPSQTCAVNLHVHCSTNVQGVLEQWFPPKQLPTPSHYGVTVLEPALLLGYD